MKNHSFPIGWRSKIVRNAVVFLAFAFLVTAAGQACRSRSQEKSAPSAQASPSFSVHENIAYKTGGRQDEYEIQRCKLDLYIPDHREDFPTIVWFHGGSLKTGGKEDTYTKAVAERFSREGIGFAVVNYRLFPAVKYPGYTDDAAASVAWVIANIGKYGGNPRSVFAAGHSAGGYLVYMLAMDPAYLKKFGMDPADMAGVIPVSGQAFTHSTIREERGIPNPENTPVIDDGAPCYHAHPDTPPILAVWADGDSPVRIEENKYFAALLQRIGNTGVTSREMKDRDHMTLITKMPEPGDPLAQEVLSFIQKNSRKEP